MGNIPNFVPPTHVHGFSFTGKVGEVVATARDEVVPALQLLEREVASGRHAAGFVAYEAAGAINSDLTTCQPADFPLLWFGLFEGRSREEFFPEKSPFSVFDWSTSWSAEKFCAAVASIRDFISAGDCYQVNLTTRQRFLFRGSPSAFLDEIRRWQPTPYSCYLEAGRFRILSASPELFFSLADRILTTRPMKGTAPRGRSAEEDLALKRSLRESPKELAENLMIVDLLRNDMGIVSETGSVRAESLFDVETYPTVHQMTSTIVSRVREGVGVVDLLKALFPCGSVTGAPKRRSMEIIAETEGEARGLYTGCLGYLSPGGEANFSVAIRTVVLDVESGRGEVGIGSGITYDSVAADEYAEVLSKSRFAREAASDFELIESLLYEDGYFLLERHLERLARSASYFSFPVDPEAWRVTLEAAAPAAGGKHKVRLLLFRDGRISCESAPIEVPAVEATAAFASASVDSGDPFLYHKTSRRETFRRELALRPEVTEVIFSNEREEVTEGANSNIVALVGGELLTPPAACGLLPGVFREELLATGRIKERVLTRRDIEETTELYLINSVRKWRKVRLVQTAS